MNTRSGPHNLTAALRVLEIIYGVTFYHLSDGGMMRLMGEDGGAQFLRRWRTRHRITDLGQKRGSPEDLCWIFFPTTPLLWAMSIRVTNMDTWGSASGTVAIDNM